MRPSRRLRLLLGLLSMSIALDAQAGSSRDRRFFSARHGIGIEAPPGWTLSQHTGYPSILVLLLQPNGSRISVSAAPTLARDARSLVDQNRRGLQAQRLAVTRQASGPRGGILIEARATDREEVVRQLYLVRSLGDDSRQAVVITLVTRPIHLVDATTGFDWALGHLALETPTGRGENSPDAGTEDGSTREGAAPKERR